MKVKALDSIVSLFALVAAFKPDRGLTIIINTVEVYLLTRFSQSTTDHSLGLFHKKVVGYLEILNQQHNLRDPFLAEEIEKECKIIIKNVRPIDRFNILIYLLEYLPYISDNLIGEIAGDGLDLIHKIARNLEISDVDFNDAKEFTIGRFEAISESNSLFLISDNQNVSIPKIPLKVIDHLQGQLIFLKIDSLNVILFRVLGEEEFELNNIRLFKRRTYYLKPGAVIKSQQGDLFFYNDIYKALSLDAIENRLILKAHEVEYLFPNGYQGIHKMSFDCTSGEMVAIMGGSGSGKTTLMNLLIGAYKPYKGKITLNGVDIFSNPDLIKGYIGFVPQDDALNEDLTAFDNLYYAAALSSGQLSKQERINVVDQVLNELGLTSISNLKVGNPLEKVISGGQRKRLNIAIELIRDPGVLFLDEPTSGLSSADSEVIINVLRMVADKGHLVILNIHQPSSDLFKLFDQLLFIDQGGYPVYFGPAVRVISYLKEALQLTDAHESECECCGNLNPEDVFHLVNTKRIMLNANSSERILTPSNWMNYFHSHLSFSTDFVKQEFKELTVQRLNIPHKIKQFQLYLSRLISSKVSAYPTLLLNLILPAVLALLLGIFAYYEAPTLERYSFHENENIPAFFFMSVIVALFVGVMSGSAEINRDLKTLKRESFLDLSFGAYLFSKLIYLLVLNALQVGSYVVISSLILKIPSGLFGFFMIMWALAVSASCLGLFLSSLFKSMASIYVSIPFILIPQILFSGAVIDFNKINKIFSSNKFVPLISEVMPSRWGYEGLMVNSFVVSPYAQIFYELEKDKTTSGYYRNFLIPELEKAFYGKSWSTDFFITDSSVVYNPVINGINQIEGYLGNDFNRYYNDTISGVNFNKILTESRELLSQIQNRAQEREDSVILSISSTDFDQLKAGYNKMVLQILTDETNLHKIKQTPNEFVRKMAPIYFMPDHPFGRSHLYAAYKRIGHWIIPTSLFDTVVIWVMSILALIGVSIIRPRY